MFNAVRGKNKGAKVALRWKLKEQGKNKKGRRSMNKETNASHTTFDPSAYFIICKVAFGGLRFHNMALYVRDFEGNVNKAPSHSFSREVCSGWKWNGAHERIGRKPEPAERKRNCTNFARRELS
ncbi:hypothetical protein SESBI_08197 [Sesbania bispinosa]|nr:hypothetical protein SESBI_08197 [Sesbania bispinosa]